MSDPPPISTSLSVSEPIKLLWWHWIIGLALAFLITTLAPRGKSPEFAHLAEGSISPTDIIAPIDFEILKSPDELGEERSAASGEILPVLNMIDSVKAEHIKELENFASEFYRQMSSIPASMILRNINEVTQLESEDSLFLARGSDKLFKRFGFRLSSESWKFLVNIYTSDKENNLGLYKKYFDITLRAILLDLYSQGVIDVPKEDVTHYSGNVSIRVDGEEELVSLDRLLTLNEANERLSILLSEWFQTDVWPEGAISASYEMTQPFLSPNVIYDTVESERRRENAVAKVPIVKGFVKKDELIVGSNIRVSADHIEKLNSLAIKRAELDIDKGGIGLILQILGHLMIAMIIVALFWIYIALARKEVWYDWKQMLLVFIVLSLVHLFQYFVPIKYELSHYMFPVAVGVMLFAILIDRGIALTGLVAMSLIAGFLQGNDFPIVFSTIAVGGSAAFAVRRVQTRGDVMKTGMFIAAVYIPLVVAFQFIKYDSGVALWSEMLVALVNSLFSPILVLGLVYLFENIFKITTDLSLLELIDLNRPLLRELALKSPGTYHHSIMVGSLAEAAARDINANALLTRAGAYYHDIGKMENKDYYIENQEAGSPNIHDRLSPKKSAEIVVRHVTKGIELAEEHGLPEQVKAFITEHHGCTKLAYFYDKAMREKGEVDENEFRYPGPNPQSKETGILMLADVVEAATRSIEDPSSDELFTMVDGMIRKRLSDGDLDECPLTLGEITKIRDAFLRVLSGIYHQRIPYPGQKKPEQTKVEVSVEETEN